jgi:hypothetical protein
VFQNAFPSGLVSAIVSSSVCVKQGIMARVLLLGMAFDLGDANEGRSPRSGKDHFHESRPEIQVIPGTHISMGVGKQFNQFKHGTTTVGMQVKKTNSDTRGNQESHDLGSERTLIGTWHRVRELETLPNNSRSREAKVGPLLMSTRTVSIHVNFANIKFLSSGYDEGSLMELVTKGDNLLRFLDQPRPPREGIGSTHSFGLFA